MTKKAIRGIVAATMISAGAAVCMNVNTSKEVMLSDFSLANVEALADPEITVDLCVQREYEFCEFPPDEIDPFWTIFFPYVKI